MPIPSSHQIAAEVLRIAMLQLETTRQGRAVMAALDEHHRSELGGLLACIANNAGTILWNQVDEALDASSPAV